MASHARAAAQGIVALLVAALVAALGTGSAFAVGVTATYEAAASAYDAPARLSLQDTSARYVRGSPARPGDASWGRSVSVRDDVVAANTAGGGRGLNNFGGIISQEGTNAAGGRVFTSTGTITQNDFAGIVNSGLMRGDDVHILTGAHGTPAGSLIADASMYADDVARFGDLPGVTVHNLPAMTPAEVSGVLRSPGTIIGGFCDSAACLAPFK